MRKTIVLIVQFALFVIPCIALGQEAQESLTENMIKEYRERNPRMVLPAPSVLADVQIREVERDAQSLNQTDEKLIQPEPAVVDVTTKTK